MTHRGYFSDVQGPQPVYRCCQCPYDTFQLEDIRAHRFHAHQELELPDSSSTQLDWLGQQQEMKLLAGKTVGISILTWQNGNCAVQVAQSVIQEAYRLENLGAKVKVFWADNGSTDSTRVDIQHVVNGALSGYRLFPENMGQSIARNALCEMVVESECDYWLMLDGDITLIPYSAYAMAVFLRLRGPSIACIGLNAYNCTPTADLELPSSCRYIADWMATERPEIAWTQYGMFAVAPFHLSIKFEEGGPFGGPGWGFEDDDLWLQMDHMGLRSVNSQYFRYLHQNRHSSLAHLGQPLVTKVFEERKAFLLAKWGSEALTFAAHARLARIANQTCPMVR